MAATKTIIKFPKYLKLGARNKKDPHVRVIGLPDAVREATQRIRYELQPHNKITMKLDVSWTCHSHIIGKGGNTIQPVVKRTGVSIHFPDGNKNSEFHKSNQVSINSRGEEINGLEEARSAIRELTPLIFTFSLPATAQFISVVDTSLIIIQVQNTYNVQAELKLVCEETLFGSVKGTEWDAVRVKEATLCLLHALCGNLANQMTVQMIIEISPQHHSFILGRNSEGIRRIMQRTATRIIFPDANDPLLSPLSRSTITISGAIENVYLARQNLIGSLPLVLMFDMPIDLSLDQREANQIMQTLDVFIIDRSKRVDGRRSVVIKGAERNASNIYEAWRLVMKCGKSVPKAKIPPGYNVTDMTMCGLNQCLMGPVYCNHYSRSPCEDLYQNANSSLSCCQEVLCSNSVSGESYCALSPSNDLTESVLPQNDLSGSDGSLFQPLSNSNESQNNDIVDVDYLITLIPDRRAPGCEKKQSAVADYITKKLLATKVMKQPVLSQPRVPTSTWSGFGFSKTATSLLFSEIAKEEKMSAQDRNGWNNEKSEFNSSLNNVTENSVFKGTDQVTNGHGNMELPKRKSIDYSASNYMDSIIRRTTYTKLQNLVDVNSILVFLHMEQYIDLFASQEVDYEKFLSLNDEDLKDLGVIVYGHRRKLLMTIKELCLEQTPRNKRI